MEKYAPKLSKVLINPDPHYIPGYAGYCPQLKFNMGTTYGQLTAEMLTSPDAKRTGRPGLPTEAEKEADADLTSRSPIDSNLMKVIPGYTGFIPMSRSYFACSYSEKCRKALNDFYQEGRAKIRQQSRCQSLPVLANQPLERPKPPLTPLPNAVTPCRPLKALTPPGTSSFMDDDNPHKSINFISGFTGHVPKSRFLFGKSYSVTTNQALKQFMEQQRGSRDSSTPAMPTIYPCNERVVPSFTGHIPGYKFMYGHTFGQLSQNALEKSGIKRAPQAKP